MVNEIEKWSYHEKVIQENEDLSSEDKEKVLMGIYQIKRIFGEDFLETVIQTQHPVLGYFRNLAPWTRFWLKELGNMLSALEKSVGFEKIRKRLMSTENFSSAMPELEIAYRFKKASFSIEFYPRHGRYECDLKAQKEGIKVYVEVATIGPSEEERRTWYTFTELTKPFMLDDEVTVAGKIYKTLSHPRIAEIKRKINICVQKAKKKKECTVISQPGIVDIIVCPRSLSVQASKWVKHKGISSQFEGPSYSIDEIRRARKAFRNENRQLPKNKPGLVVLYHGKILVKGNAESYRKLVYELEEEIYEHSNLVASVLIFSDVVGASEAGSYGPDFAWSRRTKHQLYGENTLVIRNKYSKFQIDDEMIRALIV